MQDEVIKAMMNPKAYDEEVTSIKLIQTHHSFVFLTGKYAYKIKKPVNLGFLDFTTLEKRKETLEKEIKLNSRLCKEIYIGVLPINRLSEKIKINGDGKTVEYVLKMKQIPHDKLLINLIKHGNVDKSMIEKIAKIISDFHSKAETNEEINKFGSLKTIQFNWKENFDQTAEFKNFTVALNQYYFIRQKVLKFLQINSTLFEKRISDGKIKDCHGVQILRCCI